MKNKNLSEILKKMKKSVPWKQLIALLLFFSASFSVTAMALGYFALPGDSMNGEMTIAPFFPHRPENQDGTAATSVPNVSSSVGDPSVTPGTITYLTNLSRAFNTSVIEGYVSDRSTVSLSDRVAAYNKLAGDIAEQPDATPENYQSYTADGYQIVRGVRLEGDFIAGSEEVIGYSKVYSHLDGSYQTLATSYTIERKKIQPYMGYLIISYTETHEVTVPPPDVTTAETTALPETTQPPVTAPPVTVPPATKPVTTAPTPTKPVTTKPVTTKPVTTTAPQTTVHTPTTTEAPVTDEPVTEPPVIEPPVIEPPVTENTPIVPENNAPTPADRSAASPDPTPVTAGETTEADPNEPQTITVVTTLLSLCDRKGNVLVENLDGKVPYYARDQKNLPVFTDSDGKFYSFDGKKFSEISESSLRVWLSYDYPAYPLGTYRNYEAVYEPSTGVYRYVNYKTGATAISTSYSRAFNFTSNGYAVVVSASDNTLQVVNSSKHTRFNAGGRYKYPTGTDQSLTAQNTFRPPDTFGIESIGSAGYDHGWLRIRVQALSQMSNTLGTIIRDWEALVDEKGNFFDIPEGYTLEGYSDGILLLSKDGLYGYYGIDGNWITQPIFTYARPFIQGLAVVGSGSGTVGMIDTSGNIVLPFVFTSLSDCSSGVITAYCEGIGWETYYLCKK